MMRQLAAMVPQAQQEARLVVAQVVPVDPVPAVRAQVVRVPAAAALAVAAPVVMVPADSRVWLKRQSPR